MVLFTVVVAAIAVLRAGTVVAVVSSLSLVGVVCEFALNGGPVCVVVLLIPSSSSVVIAVCAVMLSIL